METKAMGKFEKLFSKPVLFSDGAYILSGVYLKKDAATIFSDYIGEDVQPSQLSNDYVRFGYPPDFVEGREDLGACWFISADSGKGTKPVWVYNN